MHTIITTQLQEDILQCCIQLGNKVQVYAALIGLLNIDDYNFVGGLLQLAASTYCEAWQDLDHSKAALVLRLLASLVVVHVVTAGSVFSLITDTIKAATDMATGVWGDARVDNMPLGFFLMYRQLSEKKMVFFVQLMTTVFSCAGHKSSGVFMLMFLMPLMMPHPTHAILYHPPTPYPLLSHPPLSFRRPPRNRRPQRPHMAAVHRRSGAVGPPRPPMGWGGPMARGTPHRA